MKNEQQTGDAQFADLTSFRHIATAQKTAKSNIIKSSAVELGGSATIEILDGAQKEPTVHIHRNGDQITKIEFICSCGKSTHIDMEYEEE